MILCCSVDTHLLQVCHVVSVCCATLSSVQLALYLTRNDGSIMDSVMSHKHACVNHIN